MPDRTTIIEFEGLAGCGKSTLCEELKVRLSKQGYNVIYIDEKPFRSIFHDFKRIHLHRYLQTFSINILYNTLKLMLKTHQYSKYKHFYKLYELCATYNYLNKYKTSHKQVIVCDEGIIQSLVSIWGYDAPKTFTEIENSAILTFLSFAPSTNSFVCDISIEDDILRIRKRGRKHGRLNIIKNDEELKEKLNNNLRSLEQIISIAEVLNPEPRLDMRNSPCDLANIVVDLIQL